MRHKHFGGRCRHHSQEHGPTDHREGRPHHHRGGRGRGRLFDYGELRLLALAMFVEQPRHGYELIKAIEERFGGSYSPSPGVIYPTLSWLEDMGYIELVPEEGARKRYRITAEGGAFLEANRAAVDELRSRGGSSEGRGPGRPPAPVIRAMENLKTALRLKLREGQLDDETLQKIAAAIDAAAQTVERS
ncbi:Transcriptional regulator YqjI [Hartmannibacter diazotrophicus]|uniref:Transcriptional regulator YqjI n=1 Tax=Hartmannibacter diazotrophicus TaxID=1482074 RepID=A0A2C9D352_9HYPH|nr:PadR family transcriptional regulator [Hartmannibacter diazotrophicus]SON54588.1 Transcriptional regulator YqjI [Hartmannibacter diazotrophicus]